MQKKMIFAAAAVAIVACLAWAGNEPWKTKPYKDWDQKDIKEVLNNSPWSKTETVTASWQRQAPQPGTYGTPGGRGAIGGGAPPTTGGGGMGAGQQGGQAQGNGPMMQEGPMAPGGSAIAMFQVRWNSSLIVREALVQAALLEHRVPADEAAKYLAQVPTTYQIAVSGSDLTPFANLTADELKDKTLLEAKQSKQKVSPSNVDIRRSDDGKRVIEIIFTFPKASESGSPLVTPKDKNVEFACIVKNLNLRATFDLHKMTTDKGLDL